MGLEFVLLAWAEMRFVALSACSLAACATKRLFIAWLRLNFATPRLFLAASKSTLTLSTSLVAFLSAYAARMELALAVLRLAPARSLASWAMSLWLAAALTVLLAICA